MENKDVNLDQIHKLPEPEFKKHFLQWVEEDGVARALQAKLRKDLIDNFNKTNLGRKIFAQYSRSHRMILSPLILALNTLVAEFLYAQNCHFSLSVFSTEVPYRNTLPDFENHEQFRFTRADLFEIFEAISIDISDQVRDSIIRFYISSSTKDKESLLYIIFKHIFKSRQLNVAENKSDNVSDPNVPKRNDAESKVKIKTSPAKKNLQSSFYNNHFRYLNKYLIILSKKVKEMSNSLEQLERREVDTRSLKRRSDQTRNIESLNRSLAKISENLRVLSLSKRKNRKISAIISSVDKMAQQLQKCADNFETISQNIRNRPKFTEKNVSVEEKSYADWIRELKNSKSGKKFTAKIETSLRNTLEKEKEKLVQAFDAKLENQKALIKLKYKQKLLQQIENHSPTEGHNEKVKSLIEKKLEELDKKHEDLLQKLNENQVHYKENEPLFSIGNGGNVDHNSDNQSSNRRKFASTISNNGNSCSHHVDRRHQPVENLAHACQERTKGIKPQLEEMAKTIAEQERNIEHIIFGAKLRFQELEHESNQLERSFQDYLQRQQDDKNRLNVGVTTIWENYKHEKYILNKRYVNRAQHNGNHWNENDQHLCRTNSENIHPKLALTASNESSKEEHSQKIYHDFENPFRKLQTEILVKESWKPKQNSNFTQEDPRPQYANASTSPVLNKKSTINSRKETITIKVTSPEYAEEVRNVSPISSELCFKDTTLDGIVLSDSKSSSAKNNSMPLNVPDTLVLNRNNIETSQEKSTDTSNSISNKLNISTGKREYSDGEFWD